MKEELVFYEHQRYNRWLVAVLFIAINAPLITGFIIQTGMGKPWGDTPLPDPALMSIMLFTLLLSVSFYFMRLNTVINKEGVYVQFFPFHLRYKFIPWNHVMKAEVRKMNPMRDGAGWGLRYKRKLNISRSSGIQMISSASYTIYGNKVLQLTLNNNKKITIGTRRLEELSEFLVKLDAERK